MNSPPYFLSSQTPPLVHSSAPSWRTPGTVPHFCHPSPRYGSPHPVSKVMASATFQRSTYSGHVAYGLTWARRSLPTAGLFRAAETLPGPSAPPAARASFSAFFPTVSTLEAAPAEPQAETRVAPAAQRRTTLGPANSARDTALPVPVASTTVLGTLIAEAPQDTNQHHATHHHRPPITTICPQLHLRRPPLLTSLN